MEILDEERDDPVVNEHQRASLHKFGGSKVEQIEWGGNGTIDPAYTPVRFSPWPPPPVSVAQTCRPLHPATASSQTKNSVCQTPSRKRSEFTKTVTLISACLRIIDVQELTYREHLCAFSSFFRKKKKIKIINGFDLYRSSNIFSRWWSRNSSAIAKRRINRST